MFILSQVAGSPKKIIKNFSVAAWKFIFSYSMLYITEILLTF